MDYLTPKEVAELLKLSLSMVYKLLREGDLPHVRIGRSRRIRREDLEKYIQTHRTGG